VNPSESYFALRAVSMQLSQKKVIVVATFSDSCHCNILCLVRKLLAARVGVYFVGELQSNPAEGSFIKSPLPLLDEGGGRVGKVVKTRHAFSIE
jgi:hypothetical protein